MAHARTSLATTSTMKPVTQNVCIISYELTLLHVRYRIWHFATLHSHCKSGGKGACSNAKPMFAAVALLSQAVVLTF
jgi:hypothetical protein